MTRRTRLPVMIGALTVAAGAAAVASAMVFGESELSLTTTGPSHTFIRKDASGFPVGFDPCSTIHYVVNPDLAPPGAFADVFTAVEIVEEATSLRFEFEGLTDEVPTRRRLAYQPWRYGDRWAPLLVAWTDPTEMRFTHAFGVAKPYAVHGPDGTPIFVSGVIALNADATLETGFEPGLTWGEVLLHELGHILGLGHVDDPAQIMYGGMWPGPARLGEGDLQGLRSLLLECRDVPPAASVRDPGG